jgi:tetratricopeptide (TPR) repeat protein
MQKRVEIHSVLINATFMQFGWCGLLLDLSPAMLKQLIALALMAAAACPAAHAGPDQWIEVSSSHFVVLTNSNEKQATHVLDQFERMRWVFQTLFPKLNTDPPAPIFVYAAKNGKTFQSVEPQAYLAKGQLALAGYFLTSQDQNYILLRLDGEQEHPFAIVYHEYTHLQFRSAGDWMPLWLNEGLAEFFQNTEIRDRDVLLGEPSADNILYLRQQSLIPLPVLFKVDANSPYYHQEEKGSVFYAEAWALTHFLEITDHENRTTRLGDYMNRMAHHEDSAVAAEKAFGNLKQLQSALEAYIHASQYKEFVIHSAAAAIDESAYTVRSISQVNADVSRAEILAMVQREKESREIIDAILKTDPNNVRALETMGSIELHAGNHDAARKWYGEAVKLDSKSYLANYYFASISMRYPGGEGDAAIESSFRAAIQLNPRFAPAYDGLASFYAMRHMKLDEAYSLAVSAVKLDPGSLYIRMNAANVTATMGRSAEATAVLQAAARLARNPSEAAMVQSRIDQLYQFQQAKAQAEKGRRDYEAQQQGQPTTVQVNQAVAATSSPRHPAEANGPKHSFIGVMRGVTCSYPSVLEFQVEGATSTINLYSNNFAKIDLTVVGFTPKDSMNPCSDFNGMKARVQYAETTDKTVDGQVFAIELRK